MKKYRILLVDDSPEVLATIYSVLKDEGFQCTTASSGESAFERLDKGRFDLVLTDLNMYQVSGIDVLRKSKKCDPATAVMILTGNRSLESWREAKRLGVDDYMLKPCSLNLLLGRIRHCLTTPTCQSGMEPSGQEIPWIGELLMAEDSAL